ncbi:hypothetical protein GGI12_004644 [Dipsacomyces acuminosporus]|nr:hypothetical protein GGI12_004644 [Dipsacomyces acuminosporus]
MGQPANSRIRVEVEWITDGAGGNTAGNSSSEDLAGLPSSMGQFGQSTINSAYGTMANSPNRFHQASGYPFATTSTNIATPLAAATGGHMPTPALLPPSAVLSGVVSSKKRYLTRYGSAYRNDVRWSDENPFYEINDPDTSFVRLAMYEDDAEIASTCISIESLKEGYRFIELGENEKHKLSRPICLLVHIQASQLHCLAALSNNLHM